MGEHVHFCEPEGLHWVGEIVEIRDGSRYAAKNLFSDNVKVLNNFKPGGGSFEPVLKIVHTDDLHRWTQYRYSNTKSNLLALAERLQELEYNFVESIDFYTFIGPELYVNWSIAEIHDFFAKIHAAGYENARYDKKPVFKWEYAKCNKWGEKLLP